MQTICFQDQVIKKERRFLKKDLQQQNLRLTEQKRSFFSNYFFFSIFLQGLSAKRIFLEFSDKNESKKILFEFFQILI